MKVIAVNGSPRKGWNTAALLKKALEGAASQGAETELFHLYDVHFKGCISCFACKTKDGASYGKCGVNDDLTPVLERMNSADAFVLGSPIYFGASTGEMRSFMERLLFPNLAYSNPPRSLFGRKIKTGFIYTMNCPETQIKDFGGQHIDINQFALGMIFGSCESLLSFETLQFNDYSTVVSDLFNVEEREKRHREVFPQDCSKAFELGVRLVSAKGDAV
jgi:multimeric flavodoxin WrbA